MKVRDILGKYTGTITTVISEQSAVDIRVVAIYVIDGGLDDGVVQYLHNQNEQQGR
jgi:hypothetical protein